MERRDGCKLNNMDTLVRDTQNQIKRSLRPCTGGKSLLLTLKLKQLMNTLPQDFLDKAFNTLNGKIKMSIIRITSDVIRSKVALNKFPKLSKDFKNLKRISCSHNSFKQIDLSQLKNLEEVDFSLCGLEKVNLKGLKKIYTLDMSNNNLKNLDLSSFNKDWYPLNLNGYGNCFNRKTINNFKKLKKTVSCATVFFNEKKFIKNQSKVAQCCLIM